MPLKLSAQNEQLLQPCLPVGAEHEVIDDQLRAAGEQIGQRLAAVAALRTTYGFSTRSHGSARRSALSSSRRRVNSFSFARSRLRASIHASCETTG